MFVYIASDHAGYNLKKVLIEFIEKTYPQAVLSDQGAHTFDSEDDYPDYIFPAMAQMQERVLNGESNIYGIVLGGSGTGEAIVANRFEGLRAVVCNSMNAAIVRLARAHNDANVLSIGARFVDDEVAKEMLTTFLETPFEGGRHERRINKIDFNE